MPDRENVMLSLVKCSCGAPDACSDCHYNNWPLRICVKHLTDDVVTLLKAQEPRIVTEADFENADEFGFIPAWCEEKDTGEVYCECISIGALEDAKFGHVRWWTFRPDEKRRAETPWD